MADFNLASMEKQDQILSRLNVLRVVKNIQRGTVGESTINKAITISPVNPDRCIVLVNTKDSMGATYGIAGVLYTLTSNSITLHGAVDGRIEVNWQIIEFY